MDRAATLDDVTQSGKNRLAEAIAAHRPIVRTSVGERRHPLASGGIRWRAAASVGERRHPLASGGCQAAEAIGPDHRAFFACV
jgi:hypothetical protein